MQMFSLDMSQGLIIRNLRLMFCQYKLNDGYLFLCAIY